MKDSIATAFAVLRPGADYILFPWNQCQKVLEKQFYSKLLLLHKEVFTMAVYK